MVVEKKMVVNKAAPPPKAEGSKNPPRRMARLFQEFRLSIIRSLQYREPRVDVFASLIIGISVPLLQPTFELVALAGDGG
jgi:hypothetical protein